jgi:glucokinase
MVDAITGYVDELGARELPLGVSVAGTVASDGTLSLRSHIDWQTASSFGAELQQHHHGRVRIVNEGEATALGEFPNRESSATPMLAVSIGTGLGGGLVTKIGSYSGANAMSLRSATSSSNRPDDHAGAQASVRKRLGHRRDVPRPTRAGRHRGRQGGGPARRGGRQHRCRRARRGRRWLGLGLASIVAIVDPRVIVLTGGLANAGELVLAPAWRVFNERVFGGQHRSLSWERPGSEGRPPWSVRRPQPPDSAASSHSRRAKHRGHDSRWRYSVQAIASRRAPSSIAGGSRW